MLLPVRPKAGRIAVSMWPAVAFIGSAEAFLMLVRGAQEAPEPGALLSPASNSRSSAPAHEGVPATAPKIHKPLPANRPTARGMSPAPADVFAQELAAGKLPSYRRVKSVMSCGQDQATAYREQLRQHLAAMSAPAATIEAVG